MRSCLTVGVPLEWHPLPLHFSVSIGTMSVQLCDKGKSISPGLPIFLNFFASRSFVGCLISSAQVFFSTKTLKNKCSVFFQIKTP